MMCERILAVVLALIVCIAAIEGGAITNKRSAEEYGEGYENGIARLLGEENKRGVEDANAYAILDLIDALIQHSHRSGSSEKRLTDLYRKRSGIRKCFFHAVNCW